MAPPKQRAAANQLARARDPEEERLGLGNVALRLESRRDRVGRWGLTMVDERERAAIDAWITSMRLDRYGNKEGTMYAGGNPAFNMQTGEMTDRYEYIVAKHPNKPWKAFLAQAEQ